MENPALEINDEGDVPNGVHGKIVIPSDLENIHPPITPDDSLTEKTSELLYSIEDTPPWYLSILLGGQQYLTMVGATIVIPFTLIPYLCIGEEDPARGSLISTIIFVSGIVTLLQTTFGVRLPIVQGGTFSFTVPTIAVITTSFPPCKDIDTSNMTSVELDELWMERMRSIQGAIIVASLVQVIVGMTGLLGLVLAFITPLSIVPTVALVGLALFPQAADKAGTHWGISILTMFLMVLFSQVLCNINVPLPSYSKGRGCHFTTLKIFSLFSVLFSIVLSWSLCAILTATDAVPASSPIRTDANLKIISNAPWFNVPYPFQWGVPTVSASAVFGIMAGVLSSMIESIGDYYTCARISGAKPPPTHAINRGIMMEGIGCILAGIWGSGNGTTSYSENIGAIGITKVGSRRVIQFGALFMIGFGVIGKFGAICATIPAPVIGGIFCIMFSIITAIGLSSLQFVNLNSSRNIFVIGFSLFMGLTLPNWASKEENQELIKTGSETIDQIIIVMIQTSMFVGGFLGFFLDNLLPGTDEERGLIYWRNMINPEETEDSLTFGSSYDMPIGMSCLSRHKWTQYIPISPTFTGWGWLVKKIKKK